MKTKVLSCATICAILMISTACNTSALLGTLNAVVVAADAAVATLSATGTISPVAATLAINYLKAITTAVSETTVELSSTDTVAQKSEKIAADFALAMLPTANLPAPIAAVLKAVDAAVQAFIASIHPSSGISANVVKPSFSEHRQLSQINAHAKRLHEKLIKLGN